MIARETIALEGSVNALSSRGVLDALFYPFPMPIIDVSHAVRAGMTTYPGLPGPVICDFLSRDAAKSKYAPGVSFQIGKIELVANTGTYVDSPFHRYEDGADLAALPIEQLADLDTIVVHVRAHAISAATFAGLDLEGRALVIHTDWATRWGTARYFEPNPFVTDAGAEFLAKSKVAFVGIDSVNIDDMTDLARPAHSILLGAGIPICEHMAHLEKLPDRGARLHAVPVKVERFGTFPVRAYAIVR